MNRKELFSTAVKVAIDAFNTVDEETVRKMQNLNVMKSFFKKHNFDLRSERLEDFATIIRSFAPDFSYSETEPERTIQPFLIVRAPSSDRSEHNYGVDYFFIRGAAVVNGFIITNEARRNLCELGEPGNQVPPTCFWETPKPEDVDEVVDLAWNLVELGDNSLAQWFNTYAAPISFLFNEKEPV